MRITEAVSVPKGFYDVGNWTFFREQKYVVMWVSLVAVANVSFIIQWCPFDNVLHSLKMKSLQYNGASLVAKSDGMHF